VATTIMGALAMAAGDSSQSDVADDGVTSQGLICASCASTVEINKSELLLCLPTVNELTSFSSTLDKSAFNAHLVMSILTAHSLKTHEPILQRQLPAAAAGKGKSSLCTH